MKKAFLLFFFLSASAFALGDMEVKPDALHPVGFVAGDAGLKNVLNTEFKRGSFVANTKITGEMGMITNNLEFSSPLATSTITTQKEIVHFDPITFTLPKDALHFELKPEVTIPKEAIKVDIHVEYPQALASVANTVQNVYDNRSYYERIALGIFAFICLLIVWFVHHHKEASRQRAEERARRLEAILGTTVKGADK